MGMETYGYMHDGHEDVRSMHDGHGEKTACTMGTHLVLVMPYGHKSANSL